MKQTRFWKRAGAGFWFFLSLLTAQPGCFQVLAQEGTEQSKRHKLDMAVFKDSVDGKLDMGRFLTEYNGFIPMPQIITEPALGHFGLMLAPVFIKPNKVKVPGKYIPPDITAAFVGFTANNTWGLGALRMASLPKHRLKYRVGAVYADVNLDFYRTLPEVGEEKFGFNFNITGVYGSVLRGVGDTDLYIGIEYSFAHNKIKPDFEFEELPDFVGEEDLDSKLSTLGLRLEFDKRDNIFTPDKGWYLVSTYRLNEKWTGSDYSFEKLNIAAFKFFQATPRWVSGLRLEGTFLMGNAPFYMKPSVAMRGVPMARYQGDQIYTFETEQRYDLNRRWSALLIGGLAKAPLDKESFQDTELVYNYGTGFRYLIARKFKLRTGIDVAWSNDDFGWYIVFGHAWNNRN